MAESDNKKIKIFVSHTAGADNVLIDNPLFENVCGGAAYTKKSTGANVTDTGNVQNTGIHGDDTGDNISELNRHFSEYSVIYWAWKNQDCDYYGLCHYRRFLSFAEKKLKASGLRQVNFDGITPATIKEAGLDDASNMRRIIEDYDMIVPYEHNVVKHDCGDNRIKTVKQFWLRYHASYLKESEFDLILDLINRHNPEYYRDALEYMDQLNFRGFNCFVMKKEIFNEFCNYAFPMLFEFEEKCDRTGNSVLSNRNTGYAGEWFFSIFVYHKLKEGSCKIKETQLVVFSDTRKNEPIKPAFEKDSLPIAFSVSDINAHRVAATIQSIIDTKDPATNLDFILLNAGNTVDKWRNHLLAKELETILLLQGKRKDVSIRTYNPANEIGRIELRHHVKIVLKERYFGVLLPFILKNYDRVLYISDTMLCRGDLAKLLNKKISDTRDKEDNEDNSQHGTNAGISATCDLNYIAMANGFIPGYKEKIITRLGIKNIKNPLSIFSSDVIFYEPDKVRKHFDLEESVDKILNLAAQGKQPTTTEAFNLIYHGFIEPLPQKYNAFEYLEPDYPAVCEYIPQELDKGTEGAILVNLRGMHQVTRDLKLPVVKEYFGYAKKTPFYEEHLLDAAYPAIFKKEKKYVKRVHYKQLNEEYCDAHRSIEQAMADKYFPMGSPIRNVIDAVLPKNSRRQELVKTVIKDVIKR